MTLHRIVLALATCSLASFGQDKAADRKETPLLAVCDVLSKPLEYDGKLIRIRGIVEATDEGAWLVSADCPGAVVTFMYAWPSEIWLEAPMPGKAYLHPIDFWYDFANELKRNEAYRRLMPPVDPDCLAWTFTGLFETRKDWSKAYATYPNGTSKFLGFGHRNTSPAELILKSRDGFVEIEGCRQKGKGK
jgi:hypothetical protein